MPTNYLDVYVSSISAITTETMLTLMLRMLFCITFLTFCSIEVIISTLAVNAGDAMERLKERYGVSATYLLNVFIY